MIGIDVIEIERFEEFIKNSKLQQKVFTSLEIEYFSKFKDPKQRMAGFFCAKEAVLKALDCPKGATVKDIEVNHYASGKPYVKLYNFALAEFEKTGHKTLEVSISHSNTVATAVCLLK